MARQPQKRRSFFEELKTRRVYRVAAVYVVVAWALLQGADLLLPAFSAPDWVFRALVLVTLAGFPTALILAWIFDLTPEGLERTGTARVHASPLPRLLRRTAVGGLILIVLAASSVAVYRALGVSSEVDTSRVMVFPMVVSGASVVSTVGEDVATMIGHALDGTGPLRWIDGWPLLDAERRDDVRRLTLEEAQALASSRKCGFFVMGRVVMRGDSAQVLVELRDARTGEAVARGESVGRSEDPWRVGLRAVNNLLPFLIPTAVPDVAVGFADRPPAAVARFLLGESSFRRTDFRAAFDEFAAAFQEDPTFAVAAIRGAQAASWEHDVEKARELIDAALGLELLPRDREFAKGVRAYLEADAEAATTHLRAALAADPGMAVAWAQLGEVNRHLTPLEVEAGYDDASFERALATDAGAEHVVYHVLEATIARGDVQQARALLQRFAATDPDPDLAAQIDAMFACLSQGPLNAYGGVWRQAARDRPLELLVGATQLAAGGRQPACAEAMYIALLREDTARDLAWQGRYWGAFVGLNGALVARNQPEAVERLIRAAMRSFEDFGSLLASATIGPTGLTLPTHAPPPPPPAMPADSAMAVVPADRVPAPTAAAPRAPPARSDPLRESSLLALFAGAAHPALESLGAEEARRELVQNGPDYERVQSSERLWLLAYWATRLGLSADADRVTARLARFIDERQLNNRTYLTVSLDAFRSLGAADTAAAVRSFAGLAPNETRESLAWRLLASLGFERITRAVLALERGDAEVALRLGRGFDGGAAIAHAYFVPLSLQVRRDAATRLGRTAEANQYSARLRGLGWSDIGPETVAQFP